MTGHYFSPSPSSASRPATVTLALPDRTIELTTDRGVFSPDRVDPGTKYLLLCAPMPGDDTTNLLDLGCGYGAIAVTLAARAPRCTVWAVDVNERAVDLCARNAAATGTDNVRPLLVTGSDPLEGVPHDLRFDAVYSNPPIRTGKQQLHTLLSVALDRLSPTGSAFIVVHKHLGSDSLQQWLRDQGWEVTRLGSRGGYRLLAISAGDHTP